MGGTAGAICEIESCDDDGFVYTCATSTSLSSTESCLQGGRSLPIVVEVSYSNGREVTCIYNRSSEDCSLEGGECTDDTGATCVIGDGLGGSGGSSGAGGMGGTNATGGAAGAAGRGGSGGCPSELLQCGSACVDVRSDPTNCGACGFVCNVGRVCVNASCMCIEGQAMCGNDDSCVNLAVSNEHCGRCGNACTGGRSCTLGECVCPSGLEFCGATAACVDVGECADAGGMGG